MLLGVVILAAGASSRMGRPKLLLPWGTSTVLGHLLAQWRQVGVAQIAVVLAAGDAGLQGELDRLDFPRDQRILNPDPGRGMFSSIQCAAAWNGWNRSLTHWAITLGDQPQLRVETLRALSEFASVQLESVCQPAHRGRARHPVVLPKGIFHQLASTNHSTLREFLSAHRDATHLVEVSDDGLDFDLDTPADYEAARRRFLRCE